MAPSKFDVIVIGAGPGGYVAAIRAAQAGLRTACVDVAQLGGVCNNVGCIPTKAMLESAAYAHRIEHLADFGLKVAGLELDLLKAAEQARQVADQGAKGIAYLFRKNDVTFVQGWGRLVGRGSSGLHRVTVSPVGSQVAGNPISCTPPDPKVASPTELEAKAIIIATGSRPRSLPMLKPDGNRVWSSDDAVYPTSTPASLAIIGAGAVGMESRMFTSPSVSR